MGKFTDILHGIQAAQKQQVEEGPGSTALADYTNEMRETSGANKAKETAAKKQQQSQQNQIEQQKQSIKQQSNIPTETYAEKYNNAVNNDYYKNTSSLLDIQKEKQEQQNRDNNDNQDKDHQLTPAIVDPNSYVDSSGMPINGIDFQTDFGFNLELSDQDLIDRYHDLEQKERDARNIELKEKPEEPTPDFYVDSTGMPVNGVDVLNSAALASNAAKGSIAGMDFDRYDATKPEMTGERYIWEIQNGLNTGRPIEEINPYAIYNRLDEHYGYGYNPVAENQQQIGSYYLDRLFKAPSDAMNELKNARTNLFDWKINNAQDSQGNDLGQISGGQFNIAQPAYFKYVNDVFRKEVDEEGNEYQPNLIPRDQMTDDMLTDPNYVKMKSNGYTLHLEDGEELTYPLGTRFQVDSDQYNAAMADQENVPFILTIVTPDGQSESFEFESMNDYKDNFREDTDYSLDPENDEIVGAFKVDPMTLDDGTQLDFLTVDSIANRENGTADYGLFNMAKPQGEVTPVLEWDDESGGLKFDLTDIFPYLTDIGASSAIYMAPPSISVPAVVSNMYQGLKGIDQRSMTPDKVYSPIDPTFENNDVAVSNLLGEPALAATERFLGTFGQGSRAGRGLLDRVAPNLAIRPMLNHGQHVLGEGLEEVIQSPIEDAMSKGTSGTFADYVRNENGDLQLDDYNRYIVDYDTPIEKRFTNFLKNAPENLFAGSLFGGVLTAPQGFRAMRESGINMLNNKAEDNREANGRLTPRFVPIDQLAGALDEAREKGYVNG